MMRGNKNSDLPVPEPAKSALTIQKQRKAITLVMTTASVPPMIADNIPIIAAKRAYIRP